MPPCVLRVRGVSRSVVMRHRDSAAPVSPMVEAGRAGRARRSAVARSTVIGSWPLCSMFVGLHPALRVGVERILVEDGEGVECQIWKQLCGRKRQDIRSKNNTDAADAARVPVVLASWPTPAKASKGQARGP